MERSARRSTASGTRTFILYFLRLHLHRNGHGEGAGNSGGMRGRPMAVLVVGFFRVPTSGRHPGANSPPPHPKRLPGGHPNVHVYAIM